MARRIIQLALKATTAVTAILFSLVLTAWGASCVLGPASCQLSFSFKCHAAVGDGQLLFYSDPDYDAQGNLVPYVVECRSYRGEPAIVRCIAGSAAGFRWNYCEFAQGIGSEWAFVLPIGPLLVLLGLASVASHRLGRRYDRALSADISSDDPSFINERSRA